MWGSGIRPVTNKGCGLVCDFLEFRGGPQGRVSVCSWPRMGRTQLGWSSWALFEKWVFLAGSLLMTGISELPSWLGLAWYSVVSSTCRCSVLLSGSRRSQPHSAPNSSRDRSDSLRKTKLVLYPGPMHVEQLKLSKYHIYSGWLPFYATT